MNNPINSQPIVGDNIFIGIIEEDKVWVRKVEINSDNIVMLKDTLEVSSGYQINMHHTSREAEKWIDDQIEGRLSELTTKIKLLNSLLFDKSKSVAMI